jgi:hypothetical protein
MDENLTRHADSRISERRRDFFKIQIQSEFATESRDYTRISHKMTVNGYLLFDSIQSNQRTNTHEYKEKRAIKQPPHRSAIFQNPHLFGCVAIS